MDIREGFFPERGVKHRNRLPGEWWNHNPWKCSKRVDMALRAVV